MKTKQYIISFVIFGFLLSGCGAAPVVTPTVTPTATALAPQIILKDVRMALVPAGRFMMGSDTGSEDEKPPHAVSLEPFYIDQYEVTNARYKVCMNASACTAPHYQYYDRAEIENHPVIYVNWDQAVAYCQWRGARLPSEAEWEYAARGDDGRTYPWGEGLAPDQANPKARETNPVGSYENGKSPFGLYDMAGNVSEWVNDLYDPYPGGDANANPGFGQNFRVVRGGAWGTDDFSVRATARKYLDASIATSDVGLRCAVSQSAISLTPAVMLIPTSTFTITPTLTPRATPTPGPQDIVQNGVAMAHIPAGSFVMGSNGYNDDEKPPHTVSLNAFYMDKYEVTNALYKACVDAGGDGCLAPYKTDTHLRPSYYGNPEFDHYPVVYVSSQQAISYCKWRGARLPTEAEWEYAARGSDGRIYPWGNQADPSRATSYDDGIKDTRPVGSYETGISPFGLYDMVGNVWEWVNDWYDAKYYEHSPAFDPHGPATLRYNQEISYEGQTRVIRGGGFDGDLYSERGSQRFLSDVPMYNIGFRCAFSSPGVTPTPMPKPYPSEIAQNKATMLLIPAGSFAMGSDDVQQESPIHIVLLDPFYLDKYEVTNAAYKTCVDAGVEDCNLPLSSKSLTRPQYYGNPLFDQYPVMNVNWHQAHAYCEWRGARLPTEAEWEYAARGADGRTYPWGNTFTGKEANFCDANCNLHAKNQTYNDGYEDSAQVNGYEMGKSPFGIYNMAGNVWEWVNDWYTSDYYQHSPSTNSHVVRGGALGSSMELLRATSRNGYDANAASYNFGFRCALTP